ncbi:MAG: hypothetical protein ABH864_00910 [archaeon]
MGINAIGGYFAKRRATRELENQEALTRLRGQRDALNALGERVSQVQIPSAEQASDDQTISRFYEALGVPEDARIGTVKKLRELERLSEGNPSTVEMLRFQRASAINTTKSEATVTQQAIDYAQRTNDAKGAAYKLGRYLEAKRDFAERVSQAGGCATFSGPSPRNPFE